MKNQIITRFAPSPTGYLHVGGARTALFNFLLTKKERGKFRLRIEDTDSKRSNETMTKVILNGMKWLGLQWDEEVVFQGANAQRHREMVNSLVEKGWSYLCFCSQKELEVHRKNYRYDGTCRKLSPKQVEDNKKAGKPYVIRFKVPEGRTFWKDEIHGDISIENEEIEDFIILRSDGSPTYNLAVVVDDHDMSINFILRGDDHISNTPKQMLLYKAFQWEIPRFAHVPLILGPDKKRLSKRHGATSVDEYRKMGVLPEALFNFLALLGWNPKDDREILSRQEIIGTFSLDGISRKSAVFDEQKLAWLNQQYILNTDSKDLLDNICQYWLDAKLITEQSIQQKRNELLKLIELLKPRATYLSDFVDLGKYFFKEPNDYAPLGVRKYLKNDEIWKVLTALLERLRSNNNFYQDNLEKIIRGLAEEQHLSAGKIIHPIRLAITGRTASPGLFEIMEYLGKDTVLRRMDFFLNKRKQLQEAALKGQE